MNNLEDFNVELKNRVDAFCNEIKSIWNEIGVNESCQSDRAQEAMALLEQICTGMIDEEKSNLNKLKESVKLARKDIEEITRALKLQGVDEPQQLPLMQLEAFLKSEADKLRVMKKERMDQLEKLMSTATELSKELGEKFTCTVKPGEIPADCELKYLAQDVERLKFLKIERVSQAEDLLNEIKHLYGDLEESWHDLSLSKHLLSCEVSNLLTLSSLKDLQRLKEQLLEKQEALEEKSRSLRQQLESMYTRLDLQMLQLQQFLHRHPTAKPSDLASLENELEKCFELRKCNIEKFVINCRRELEQYWNCLHINEERRQEMFKPFVSTNYSETLLELHEAELEKTKERFEKARPILDLFNQYSEVWSEFVEIERKANDPARLLARGRGKGLLQEQRERREIEKKMPKLEEKLKTAVGQWELEEAEPFMVFDYQILDFICLQKEELNQEKEALKKAKHEEKEREKLQEIRFGTAAVKRGAGAMGGHGAGGHKTPKKSKMGTTIINATNSNQCMKTTISSGSNKSRNILLSSATKAKSSLQQPVIKPVLQTGTMGQKAAMGKMVRQPNFGVQAAPLRGFGGVLNKPAAVPLNPAQKAKRRSLAQLNKKKEAAGPSKLAAKENIPTATETAVTSQVSTEAERKREVRRSRRIRDLNESKRSDGPMSNVSHMPNVHEHVNFSVLNETYSTFSNKISGDLASSMLMQDTNRHE